MRVNNYQSFKPDGSLMLFIDLKVESHALLS